MVDLQIGHFGDNFLTHSRQDIICPQGLTATVKGLSKQITHLSSVDSTSTDLADA